MKTFKQITKVFVIAFLILNFNIGNAQSNPNNPYDYVGSIHNEILTEFYKTRKENKSNTIQENIDKISLLTTSNKNFNKHFTNKNFNWATSKLFTDTAKDAPSRLSNVINNLKISKQAKNLSIQLLDIVLDNDYKDLNKFYNLIIEFENSIINSKLNNDEKEHLLCSSSIARYSAFLAFGNSQNNDGVQSKSKGSGWRIAADVGGGILGWAFGGVAGGIAGAAFGTGLYDTINAL